MIQKNDLGNGAGDTTALHDVIIVGGGPCGLAVAARLCEHTPSAIFTDEEHQRYHWIRKHGRNMSIKHKKSLAVTPAASRSRRFSTLVLDASGNEWMARWNYLFRMLGISHLRSPMFFHVDPCDRDALLAFAHEEKREKELIEVPGCVGKEISKHRKKKAALKGHARPQGEPLIDERDRKDYYTPSTPLFTAHCECVIDRYGLRKGLVRQEAVQDIVYDVVHRISDVDKVFSVRTETGTHYARTVVLAVGPANAPCIPGALPTDDIEGACHTMRIKSFPDPSYADKIKTRKETNIMVVGGGLTSAQVADLAIRKGVTKVWHLMRGPLKVKPFDLDLPWLGKFRNLEQAKFWTADTDEERLEMILKCRNGGSLNPRYLKIEKALIASGRVSLHTHTTIASRVYDKTTKTWSIKTSPPIESLPPIDYIYFATGVQTDFNTLPFLQSMIRDYPIPGKGGFPCLTDDMMWKEDVPLFVTGKLAALRLGPGAPNLVGARLGAERIAWAIQEVLDDRDESSSATAGFEDPQEGDRFRYCTGTGNRFQCFEYPESEADSNAN